MADPYAVASAFDNLQSLQLLIDQFTAAEEWAERDEVLGDIIEHESAEALVFLRMIADNEAEDVYTRCDAICGIVRRTAGAEKSAELIAYLADPDSVYEYCKAADTVAEVALKAAEPSLWEAWAKELEEEALHSTVSALEAAADVVEPFMNALEAMTTLDSIDFIRAELMLQALGNLKAPVRDRLEAFELSLLALAKAHPDDDGEPTDLAAVVHAAILRIDAVDDDA